MARSHTLPPHLVPQSSLAEFLVSLLMRFVTLASGSAFWGPGLRQGLRPQEVAGLAWETLAESVVTALSPPLSGSEEQGREWM